MFFYRSTDLGILNCGMLADLFWLLFHFHRFLVAACFVKSWGQTHLLCKQLDTAYLLRSSMLVGLLHKFPICNIPFRPFYFSLSFTWLVLLHDLNLCYLYWRSMVNCITLNPTSRVALASCRNAFTMVTCLPWTCIRKFILPCLSLGSFSKMLKFLWFFWVLKVANLSLFAVALAVFSSSDVKSSSDIETQVIFTHSH